MDLVTLGETMGLFVRVDNSDRFQRLYVGAESNVAVALARLGHRVRWVSRLGEDDLGDYIAGQLNNEGVEAVVERDPDRNTGLMLKELHGDATAVRYYRHDSAASAIRSVPPRVLDGAARLHLTGITPALSEGCRRAVHELVDRASERDIRFSFDVNYRPPLWDDAREARRELLALARRAHLVFAGTDEAEFLTDTGDPQAFAHHLGLDGERQFVVKQGAHGATHVAAGSCLHSPALPTTVVDLTGAGDAFAAGYLSATIRGASVLGRLQLGNMLASRAIQVVGDLGNALSSSEVTAALMHGTSP